MTSCDQEFAERISLIPHHGLGLSVDVYTPDLFGLVEALGHQGLECGYLEVFKAASPALAAVRRRLPSVLLEYHGEGLWVTQPDFTTTSSFDQELESAAAHLRLLGSHWMTHECAAKQMAGYSFGTYLPPLFTRMSADVTAQNAMVLQRRLDRGVEVSEGHPPLLLLEMPPLTYFGFGDLPVPDYFRRVASLAPCGMVLDIGHLWTVYRYSDARRRRSLEEFLSSFLLTFPLERVAQVHVAGLAVHETAGASEAMPVLDLQSRPGSPFWIDAHGAAIPEVLFDMLAQVLSHPKLTNLKGIALEVDTKAIPQIVKEFRRFRERFGDRFSRPLERGEPSDEQADEAGFSVESSRDRAEQPDRAGRSRSDEAGPEGTGGLLRQYETYVRSVTGLPASELSLIGSEPGALEAYRQLYLPHEILRWGGDLRDMFPQTCRRLEEAGVSLALFIEYWFRGPRAISAPYDFFLLKLDRFPDFVREVLPTAAGTADREAAELRGAYRVACEEVGQ
jgi:uncharacterized protein (UPF0276 family)